MPLLSHFVTRRPGPLSAASEIEEFRVSDRKSPAKMAVACFLPASSSAGIMTSTIFSLRICMAGTASPAANTVKPTSWSGIRVSIEA